MASGEDGTDAGVLRILLKSSPHPKCQHMRKWLWSERHLTKVDRCELSLNLLWVLVGVRGLHFGLWRCYTGSEQHDRKEYGYLFHLKSNVKWPKLRLSRNDTVFYLKSGVII